MLQHDVYLILPQRLECGLEQILLFVFHCRTVHSLDMYGLHTGQPLLLITACTAFAVAFAFDALCIKPVPACITHVHLCL